MSHYRVTTGFYSEHTVYEGDNVLLAGIVTAKAQRDGRTFGLNSVGFYDLDGLDMDDDGLGDEEREFLCDCQDIG